MAEESKKDVGESPTSTDTEVKMTKKKGILSRMWNALFRLRGDDFEKRLQHISKEEVAVLARIRRRSQRWRWMARNLIIFSVLLESPVFRDLECHRQMSMLIQSFKTWESGR
ncbi:uncharacterized protein At2g24330-like [Olea europaea subsp. europaea]|uniref:Uncharacterized protein At2g24330-like n=1 Tax=Olea europaea subsp. europaea TaxID=158383 RepID=A0A8S0VIU1_OLEEU|nr:uncharacterized protein At2g24330-like [Olea europaea subsp. europaea]